MSKVSLALTLLAAATAAAQDAPVAYTHAALETAGKTGRIEDGTLVLRGGKIEAVGANIKIPDGSRVIDARGQTIMPGIIDPFREVNVAGAAEAAQQTIVVRGRAINIGGRGGAPGGPFTRVADNFYPYETGYRVLPRSGLTGANLVTAGYGQSAVVRVTPAQPDAMVINPDGFLFTAVTNDSNSIEVVRTALETAEKVKKGMSVTLPATQTPPPATAPAAPIRQGRGGRRGFGGRGGGGPGGFTPGLTPATLKLWLAVYEGKSPLFVNAANAAAVVHLLKLLEPYKDVRLVLAAPGPALDESLDRLKGRPLRVIVRPGLSLKPNTRDRLAVAALLHEAGVEFAFGQPSQSELLALQDSPLFSVAYLVRSGLPRKAALEALTARPAAFVGLEKTHGTLEPGKSADLLFFAGDPLDPAGRLTQVLVEGRTVYED